MIFFILLAPLAAMGFLTAMEWVERWTLDEPYQPRRRSRQPSARQQQRQQTPVRVGPPLRPVQAPSVRATPTGQETPVPPMPQ
jgi:hypothetical protein